MSIGGDPMNIDCYCAQTMEQAQEGRYYRCNYVRYPICATTVMDTVEYGMITTRGPYPESMRLMCGVKVDEGFPMYNPYIRSNDDWMFLHVRNMTISCCDTEYCNG